MALPPNSESEPSSKSSSRLDSPVLRISYLTLFPEVLSSVLSSSLLGKASESGRVVFNFIQIRDFASDRHRTVDDTPFGGGPGMVLRVDVLHRAWQAAVDQSGPGYTVYLSPQGPRFDQRGAQRLAENPRGHLIFVCGHYEGVDERFIDLCVNEEVSIGDYVLTGGEIPALAVTDALLRCLPGVVGNADSVTGDSLHPSRQGLLKYPQYTRPREYEGLVVPPVLLSGDHGAIERFRASESLRRTERKRPDLFAQAASPADRSKS